jgi:hypothetical protein
MSLSLQSLQSSYKDAEPYDMMIPEVKQSHQLELIEVAVDTLSPSSRRRREGG